MYTTAFTDTRLQEEVQIALAANLPQQAPDITAMVRDGIVTLTGTVPSVMRRDEAQTVVHGVRGVRAVANELLVQQHRDDADLALAVAEALERDPNVPQGCLSVTVTGGLVELSGEVDWHCELEAAEAAVRRVPGVQDVINLATVKSPLGVIASYGW
jgi:osmotically-inducible protein OsmY